jgi:hypothetical protein
VLYDSSIMTLSITIQKVTLSIMRLNSGFVISSVIMLSVVYRKCSHAGIIMLSVIYSEFCNAECRYAELRYAEYRL